MDRVVLVFASFVVMLLVSCGGDDAPEPTATASLPTRIPFLTSASIPTATATAVPTPRPGAESAPHGTLTGDGEIDKIIAALMAKDVATLAGLYAPFVVPCTNGQGLGGPPKCEHAPGTPPEGTPVRAIAGGNCEGGWGFDQLEMASAITEVTHDLFGVIRLEIPRALHGEAGYPLVDHLVITEFQPNPGERFAIRFSLSDGRIVSQNGSCGRPPEDLNLNDYATAFEVILRGPAYR